MRSACLAVGITLLAMGTAWRSFPISFMFMAHSYEEMGHVSRDMGYDAGHASPGPRQLVTPSMMRARQALSLSQEGLGKGLCGASRKTAARWEWGKSKPTPGEVLTLARAVHKVDREVAKLLAFQFGKSLVDLGLEKPPAPPPPPPPPEAKARPLPPVQLMVESVVCAAAEALDSTPHVVRGVLRAAFSRARAMRLTENRGSGRGAVAASRTEPSTEPSTELPAEPRPAPPALHSTPLAPRLAAQGGGNVSRDPLIVVVSAHEARADPDVHAPPALQSEAGGRGGGVNCGARTFRGRGGGV